MPWYLGSVYFTSLYVFLITFPRSMATCMFLRSIQWRYCTPYTYDKQLHLSITVCWNAKTSQSYRVAVLPSPLFRPNRPSYPPTQLTPFPRLKPPSSLHFLLLSDISKLDRAVDQINFLLLTERNVLQYFKLYMDDPVRARQLYNAE